MTMPAPTPQKKSLIPWIFVAFFAVLIAVNIVFVTLAFKSYSGLADENPYERGVAYNDDLAGEAAQKAMGWQVDLEKGGDEAGGYLNLRTLLADGTPITAAVISAKLYRPVVEGMDQNLPFTDKGNGFYQARLSGVSKGNWELRILIEAQGTTYRFSKRVVL